VGNQGEWDFAIVSPAAVGTYYYRLIITDDAGDKSGIIESYSLPVEISVSDVPVLTQKQYRWLDDADYPVASENEPYTTDIGGEQLHLRIGIETWGNGWTVVGGGIARPETVALSDIVNDNTGDVIQDAQYDDVSGTPSADVSTFDGWYTVDDAEGSNHYRMVIDTFDTSFMTGTPLSALLSLQLSVESGYDGTLPVYWSTDEGDNWYSTGITPADGDIDAIGTFDLYERGIDTFAEISDVQIGFRNEDQQDAVSFDYVWVVVNTTDDVYIGLEYDTDPSFPLPTQVTGALLWDDVDHDENSPIDPADLELSNTDVPEIYIETRPTIPFDQENLTDGGQGEWDFAIDTTGWASGTYYFRMILTDSGGSKIAIFDNYAFLPKVTVQ
jgi:hypothetical protein